ncbi:MAG: NADH-quinone oxidoreductase subunit NuoF [Elusimicrobiota bacterium]|nr:NADH-quinone oxidoreductase subunit NuoF [Elusimicrobiota bacterium]
MKFEDLEKIRERAAASGGAWIKVGMSTCGVAAGAEKVYDRIIAEAADRGIAVEVKKTGCMGMCYAEPLVEVHKPGLPDILYGWVDDETAGRIVSDHIERDWLLNGHVIALNIKRPYEKPVPSEGVKKVILIHDSTSNDPSKLRDFHHHLVSGLKKNGLDDRVQIARARDLGVYNKGIVVKILPDNIVIAGAESVGIEIAINSYLEKGSLPEERILKNHPSQTRVVLRNSGRIDPEKLEDYIAAGGFTALEKVLAGKPQEIIDEMKKSALRGRGGGGYPVWMKWTAAAKEESAEKYIICNGDEGDPGAYMDRSVMEGDPYSLVEGMAIGALAIGASHGFFYIRAEYPIAIDRVKKAIKRAEEEGFLGKNIMGSGFDFTLEVRLGAGAFVCGEETALIASMHGKRGMPVPKPPYPSHSGLWGKPTVINNVETLANISFIILHGGDAFSSMGTDRSKGTKVFSLTGKVANSGLVEIEMGLTLRDIVFDIGGGLASGARIKAVQTGGPSGGVIPEQFFDTSISFDSLKSLGSIMGSGGMIVMDESDCMVDIAKFYLRFCVDESCGKCAPCRIGGYQMLQILERITSGQSASGDKEKLHAVSLAMGKASLCGLGQTAPNPVISTMHYFADEYREHMEEGLCRAGKCKSLMSYRIMQDKCKRCGLCVKHCPANAISGDRENGYFIDFKKCVKCGKCFDVCKFGAILKK